MTFDIHVSLWDWISLGVGLFGMLKVYLTRKHRLPPNVLRWLNTVGGNGEVTRVIKQAEEIVKASPEDRRKWAVGELQDLTLKRLGLKVPTSVANLIVEQAYQTWKRARK